MKGKKLSEMTDEELKARIARMQLYRSRAQIVIACGFGLKVIVLITLLLVYGVHGK